MTQSRRRKQEGGFALLLVFVMAAGIALMLYQQLPRTAFESMRGKEELLVDHAHEYQRAIQLYVAQFKAYPATPEDLEKAGNKRFLRRKFKDPFTGKDNWRFIHVDNMGQLTDSLVQKKEEKKPNQNTFITEMPGVGQTDLGLDAGGVNIALRKRPSEGNATGENGGPPPLPLPSSGAPPVQEQVPSPLMNQQQPNGQAGMNPAGMPNPTGMPGQQQPGQVTLQQAYPNGIPQYPGQVNSGVYPPGMQPPQGQARPTGVAGTINPQQPQYSGVIVAGASIGSSAPSSTTPGVTTGQMQFQQPGMQQAGANMQTANSNVGMQRVGNFGNAGGSGMGAPGGPGSPMSALQSIQQALTNPTGANMPMNLAPGMQIRGGVAGIASKHEGPSIKVINDQTNYKKWEFVYDMRKDNRMLKAVGQAQNAMMSQQPNMNGMGAQSGGPGQPGGFGQQSGFGQQNGFGQSNGSGQPNGFGQQAPLPPGMPIPGVPNPLGRR